MFRFMAFALTLMAALSLAGCASYFKRKECEKTNWYQHGHNVAMTGKRLDADDFVKQCQKVEADVSFTELDTGFKAGMSKYCTGDNVFQVGKAGKPFSYDMCDGESEKKMRAQYTKGLQIFCTPSNGYRFGTTGGIYQNVCPSGGEEAWLSEYRKGRKIYLNAAIGEKEREAQRLNSELARLESRRQMLSHQQATLNRATTKSKKRVLDMRTGTYQEQSSEATDEDSKRRADELSHQITSLNHEINQTRKKYEDLNSEVSKMRTEMATL